ncbi:MAG: hypothetical protein BGO90_12675, partial [Legionella sp. 40-6]
MDGSFILGLISGVVIGAAGHYYLQNKLRSVGYVQNSKPVYEELNELFNEFPEFMEQFKQDLLNPEYDDIDEFFLIPKEALMTSLTQRLRYDYSEEIMPLFHKLENLNYITRLPNDALLFRIEQEFHIALNQYL